MTKAADIALRVGLAFAFLYPPISAFFDPSSWIGYLPAFMRGYVPDLVLLHAFGLLEIVIALWILSGWRIALPSFAASAILVLIVVLNLPNFEVVFRDLSIAAMAFALGLAHLDARKASAT